MAAPVITSSSTASATVGTPFSYTFTATGDAPIGFSINASQAPWIVTGNSNAITGTPVLPGEFPVSAMAEDANGLTAYLFLTISVSGGSAGTSGYSGAAGNPGTSGYSGSSAYSGMIGHSGASGQSGISAFSGHSGISGLQGDSGTQGDSGQSGQSGISAFSGHSGISGLQGDSGTQGDSGESGHSGISAYSGHSGTRGDSGFSGTRAGHTFGLSVGNSTGVSAAFFGYGTVNFSGDIEDYTIVGNSGGTLVMDIWRANQALPADSTFSLVGPAGTGYPVMSSGASGYAYGEISGWSGMSVVPGDVIAFSAVSAANLTSANLTVRCS